MRRRDFLAVSLTATCSGKMLLAAPRQESRTVPAWAPAPGEIRVISSPPGRHPSGRGAVLGEISPVFYPWNPGHEQRSLDVFGIKHPQTGAIAYAWGSITGYCGSSFNTDTRQLVMHGAGHASANVCAPFCFDLNDLRWKWLDVPLPFDNYALLWFGGLKTDKATTMAYYPAELLDYDWGEVKGDWSGFGAYARPGVVQPIPGHTRGNLVHLPASLVGNKKGALLNFTASAGVLSGNYSRKSHMWDYEALRWQRTRQWFPERSGPGHWRGSQLDAETGKVVIMGSCSPSSPLFVFDVASGTYAARYPGNRVDSCMDLGGNVLHAHSRLHIMPAARTREGKSAGGNNGVTFDFLACPVDSLVGADRFDFTPLNVVVEAGWPLNASGHNLAIGWSYCPADRCLYTINGEGGSNTYWRLAPPPNARTTGEHLEGRWTLSELTFTSGHNAAPGRSWLYNRLSWDEVSRSFVFIADGTRAPVQAFRPAGV